MYRYIGRVYVYEYENEQKKENKYMINKMVVLYMKQNQWING